MRAPLAEHRPWQAFRVPEPESELLSHLRRTNERLWTVVQIALAYATGITLFSVAAMLALVVVWHRG